MWGNKDELQYAVHGFVEQTKGATTEGTVLMLRSTRLGIPSSGIAVPALS